MSIITIDGNKFKSGNDRWAPKGLCYQPTDGVDPISDDNLDTITALVSDGGDWAKLDINAIRVYQVEPEKSHDKVMELLASKGIYVMVGAVKHGASLPRDGTYPCNVLDRTKAVVDAFVGYDNVLCFSVANEVLNNPGQQSTAAAVKALVRDTKAYMASKDSYRNIPVGVAMRDIRDYTWPAAKYYTCGPASDRVDFIAYNVYIWCVGSSPSRTGQIDAYHKVYDFFKDFPVPVFFGEHGCTIGTPRPWDQIPYLYGNKEIYPAPSPSQTANMADAISGGFVFRYILRQEDKGLVTSTPNGPKTENGGFDNLVTEFTQIKSFASTAGSADPKDCSTWAESDYNPTMPAQCGSAPVPTEGTKIYLTNEISPATTIGLSYRMPGGSFQNLVTMQAGAPKQEVTVPKGADALMVVYQDTNNPDNWPMACQLLDMSGITEGVTFHGQWVAPDGTGTCQVG